MKKLILLLSVLSIYFFVNAQPGTLDPSFGNNGSVLTPAPGSGDGFQTTIARQCLLPGDGNIYLVLESNGKTKITRRLANGSIDPAYGNNGYSTIVSIHPLSAALQADGKIVVTGNLDGLNAFALARYTTSGTLDPSFGDNGLFISTIGSAPENASSVVVTADGKIIAGGNSVFNGHSQFLLVRFTPAGVIDNSFGSNGIVTTDFNNGPSSISSLALQADGKIVAAGLANGPGGGDFALARYNADGSPDLSFNSTGKTTSDFSFNDWARSVVIDGSGRIYAGGQSADNSGFPHFTIARYNSNGSPDASYNGGAGFITVMPGNSFDFLVNIRLQPDGKLIASGHTSLNPSFDIEIVRINTNGTIDNNFGNTGNGIVLADINSGSDESDFLAIQPDGKILTGGLNVIFDPSLNLYYTCFRYNADGSPDNSFDNDGYFTDFIPNVFFQYSLLFQQADGKLLATSDFNGGNIITRYLNRFNPDGSVDNSYGVNGSVDLNGPAGIPYFQPDGKLIDLSGDNGDIKLVRRNPDGSNDASFGNNGTVITDLGAMESPGSAYVQPDGKLLVGGLSRDANGADFLLIRYNANGSIDAGFGTGGFVKVDFENEDQVQIITMMPDGRIVFGGTSVVFPPDFSFAHFDDIIIRLNPDGSFDNSFGNQGKVIIDKSDFDYLGSLIVQNDGKLVYSYFASTDGGSSHSFIERLNLDGTPDISFGQNGIVVSEGVVILAQADQKMIVSGIRPNSRNNVQLILSRFDADGHIDPSFGTNGRTTPLFTGNDNFIFANLIAGNRLFVAGTGTDDNGLVFGVIGKFFLETERSITCPGNKTVNTDPNVCTAVVSDIDPTVAPANEAYTYQLTGATTGSGNGTASGKVFNKGVTTVTYTLTSDATKTCSFTVTVQDNQSPVINNLAASPNSLWPPNHKMKDITLSYTATDNCGIANTQVSVSSNEPVQSNEPGDQSPDWQIVDDHHIKLRAERLGSGNGRAYTINVTTTDISGNQTTSTTIVTVPHSQGNGRLELITNAAPNPSSNYFVVTINSKSSDRINLRLLNSQGVVVTTINNVSAAQTLKVGDKLLPGIYYLEANQGGMISTIKLVKL